MLLILWISVDRSNAYIQQRDGDRHRSSIHMDTLLAVWVAIIIGPLLKIGIFIVDQFNHFAQNCKDRW